MEFVVPGPGARDGISKCFNDLGGLSEVEIIKLMADRQESEFERLGLEFRSLWGRPLQLIDCQNLKQDFTQCYWYSVPLFDIPRKRKRDSGQGSL